MTYCRVILYLLSHYSGDTPSPVSTVPLMANYEVFLLGSFFMVYLLAVSQPKLLCVIFYCGSTFKELMLSVTFRCPVAVF